MNLREATSTPTVTENRDAAVDLAAVTSLAVRGLVPMFDAERLMFCHRIRRHKHELIREGLSQRYTIMTLLGLHEFERAGGKSPFDVEQIFASLVKDTRWIDNIGDLGLLLWLHSALRPRQVPDWCSAAGVEHAFEHSGEVRSEKTMELAWLVSGLAHNLMSEGGAVREFAKLAVRAYQKLEKNQGPGGFFGHLGRSASWSGWLRGSIGSFADQVYPIYAMTRLAQACDMKEPLARALDCAHAICQAQGPLGQWWWHYHAKRGQVVRRYPVFTVHQDGMAPMALFALGQATGQDFSHHIYKGLQWDFGNNELAQDMRDESTNLIWRSIFPKPKSLMYVDDVFGMLGAPVNGRSSVGYQVLFEGRPYHFGWLLYAFAPQLTSSTEAEVVSVRQSANHSGRK